MRVVTGMERKEINEVSSNSQSTLIMMNAAEQACESLDWSYIIIKSYSKINTN